MKTPELAYKEMIMEEKDTVVGKIDIIAIALEDIITLNKGDLKKSAKSLSMAINDAFTEGEATQVEWDTFIKELKRLL